MEKYVYKLKIVSNGKYTLALLYNNKGCIKRTLSSCHPDDKFSLFEGVRLCINRMTNYNTRANKQQVIQVLGYLIYHGIVYERPGMEAIRYSEQWSGSPFGAYIASALYEQERYKIFGPEKFKEEGEKKQNED